MFKKLFSVAVALALVAPAFADDKAAEKDIVDTAVGAKTFTKLVAAVKAAELVETLKGEGPFTVFAPTDKAFEALGDEKLGKVLADKELLTKILMVHVVKGKVMAADVVGLAGKEVNGYTVKVEGGKVSLVKGEQTVNVVTTDIKCKNGVIHVIDAVLMPGK